MSTDPLVWLVGASSMAVDYANVLKALNVPVLVIGRGDASAQMFSERTGLPVHTGGLDTFLASDPRRPTAAIVAVGVEGLASTTMRLLEYGVRRILVEKPGALHYHEIRELSAFAADKSAEVLIGYNRRMYASTLHAQRLIEEDGGVQSMHFEFTEWSHVIEGLIKAPGVKERLLIGNSTHVIDLAFYLAGEPVEMHSLVSGALSWHPDSAVFAGSGRTKYGVLFSYQANWNAPGRWGIEVLTSKRRFIFRPMETLQVMQLRSVAIEPQLIDDAIDKEFKPGLYRQVEYFLAGTENARLCTLDEQLVKWPIYEKIGGYSKV